MTEDPRWLIDGPLVVKRSQREPAPNPGFTFVGIGDCLATDVSERHDEYLAQAARQADLHGTA